jgi:hypothetical protein
LRDEPGDIFRRRNAFFERDLEGRREGILIQIADDVLEIREFSLEIVQGLGRADIPDSGDQGIAGKAFFYGAYFLVGKAFFEKKDSHQVIGQFPGRVLKVIGKGKKDPDCQEGKADDCSRKKVAGPVLPQIVPDFFEEILYFLSD